jgi:hypothetical protein
MMLKIIQKYSLKTNGVRKRAIKCRNYTIYALKEKTGNQVLTLMTVLVLTN